MSENNKFNTFPKTLSEALALIYCDKHSTKDTTPEELVEMYFNAYNIIYANKNKFDTKAKQKFNY